MRSPLTSPPRRPCMRSPLGLANSHSPEPATAHPELLHELAHLHELLQQPIELLDGGPGAARDALPPAAVDDLRPPALVLGHRADHAFDPLERPFIHLELSDPAHSRQHLEQVLERSEPLQLPELIQEVIEAEAFVAEL